MTLGPLMVDLAGTTLTDDDRALLRNPRIGGIVLFARNYTDYRQLQALCASIHTLREPRLIVAVDQEGGRVQRFRDDFTTLPPMAALGELHDSDAARARRLTEQIGWLMASELLACGVDMSFAPVLDLRRGSVIAARAFHADAHAVGSLGSALMRGMHRAGMVATGKHFPGHGSVNVDSHVASPVDGRDLSQLKRQDLMPFAHAVRNGIDAIMAGHVVYPQVDTKPAVFSGVWLQQQLRDALGFDGAVLSDDLSMAGGSVVGDTVARVNEALGAGCDMALVCNDREACLAALKGLRYEDNPLSQLRRTRLHGRMHHTWQELHELDEWKIAREAIAGLDFAPELGH